ncbi:MAG: hypothetical protein GF355_00950 [Candidatus Eisenbacteria bacterium]|nr:hypothetical protein [Candidatus Eisenbacteria bacterium]
MKTRRQPPKRREFEDDDFEEYEELTPEEEEALERLRAREGKIWKRERRQRNRALSKGHRRDDDWDE